MASLKDVALLYRFTGVVRRIGMNFGFIRLDSTGFDIFFRPEVCELVDFGNLRVGDRVSFRIQESKSHPGKLVANKIVLGKTQGLEEAFIEKVSQA